jgi:hypothetical protein
LVVRCNVPITLTPLREEWAGKFQKQMKVQWESDETTKRFILSAPRLTNFSVRASAPLSQSLLFVRLSIQEQMCEEDSEEEVQELISSGTQYTDLSFGQTCNIENFDLVSGEDYVLCVDRLCEEDDEGVSVTLDLLADEVLEPIEIE